MTVPSPDEMVAVLNLLDQMTRLLDLEMASPSSHATPHDSTTPWPPASRTMGGTSSGDPSPTPSSESSPDSTPLTSLSPLCRDLRLPCLDLLLSENVLAHILATSRMPVRHHSSPISQATRPQKRNFSFISIRLMTAIRTSFVDSNWSSTRRFWARIRRPLYSPTNPS